AVADWPGRDPRAAPAGIVGVVRAGKLCDPQAIDRSDDAHGRRSDELPGVGVDLVRQRADVLTQNAALEIVRIRAGEQAEQHLVVFAELLQETDRLRVTVRIDLAVRLLETGDANAHSDRVIRRGARLPDFAAARIDPCY